MAVTVPLTDRDDRGPWGHGFEEGRARRGVASVMADLEDVVFQFNPGLQHRRLGPLPGIPGQKIGIAPKGQTQNQAILVGIIVPSGIEGSKGDAREGKGEIPMLIEDPFHFEG